MLTRVRAPGGNCHVDSCNGHSCKLLQKVLATASAYGYTAET